MNEDRTIVFLMGCGGAGKSTYRRRHFGHLPVVDPDMFLPDPTRPTEGRDLCKAMAGAVMAALIKGRQSFVRDTTGTNIARMVSEFQLARAEGYSIVLVWVATPLDECLRRNAKRRRVVPAEVIKADFAGCASAFEILAPSADVAHKVEN